MGKSGTFPEKRDNEPIEPILLSSNQTKLQTPLQLYQSKFPALPPNAASHDKATPTAIRTQNENTSLTFIPRPKSPFLRPSTPESVALTQTTLTPNQRHVQIKQKLILQKKSGETDLPPSKSGLIGTSANLVNTIVGAGIVGIPYALKESGLVFGVILIFTVALLTDKSLRLLIEAGKNVNASSYERVMEAAFGKPGFVFVLMNMFVMSYGAMVCYLLIIKDTVPLLLGYDHGDTFARRQILLFSSCLVILPLSMQRDMADLSKTSTVSVIFDILMVLIIAIFSPARESIHESGGLISMLTESTIKPRTVFVGLGVLSFAFVCQDASFIIADSLERPSKERWGKVTRASVIICALLATIIGTAGFLGFQEQTEGNVLNNFTALSPTSSDNAASTLYSPLNTEMAVSIARMLLGSTMFFVYPLSSYIARHVMIVLLFRGRTAKEGDDHSVLARSDRRIILTLALYIAALIPALRFDDIGPVLGITGAVAGSSLSYLGPGAVYLGINGGEFLKQVRGKWGSSDLLWKYPQQHTSSGAVGRTSCEQKIGTDLESTFQYYYNVFLWYILCMPLWCSIATAGVQGLKDFKEEVSNPAQSLVKTANYSNSTTVSIEEYEAQRNETNPYSDRIEKMTMDESPPISPNGISSITQFLPSFSASKLTSKPDYYSTQDLCDTPAEKMLLKPTQNYVPHRSSKLLPIRYKSNYDVIESTQRAKQATVVHVTNLQHKMSYSSIKRDELKDEGMKINAAPLWTDFLIARTYILIGIIALTAGLASEFVT